MLTKYEDIVYDISKGIKLKYSILGTVPWVPFLKFSHVVI